MNNTHTIDAEGVHQGAAERVFELTRDETAGPMVATPDPYTHYRAGSDAPVERGVYRVVGADGERVRLLRVADDDGNRETTGQVVSVGRAELTDSFADAENPDAGFRPWQLVDGMVEEVRMVGRWVGRLVGGR